MVKGGGLLLLCSIGEEHGFNLYILYFGGRDILQMKSKYTKIILLEVE